MKAAIITFPGTNRERDMRLALKRVTGRDPLMLFHRDALPEGLDLVVLPGGFSYGDYLRCGAMAAQSPIMRDVKAFAEQGAIQFPLEVSMQVTPGASVFLASNQPRFQSSLAGNVSPASQRHATQPSISPSQAPCHRSRQPGPRPEVNVRAYRKNSGA